MFRGFTSLQTSVFKEEFEHSQELFQVQAFINLCYELSNVEIISLSKNAMIVLQKKLFLIKIHRNISNFGRCFTSGSIAGSNLPGSLAVANAKNFLFMLHRF